MNSKKQALALGKSPAKAGVVKVIRPRSVEDRLTAIENMIAMLAHNINNTEDKSIKDLNAYDGLPRNKDGVPLNVSLIGHSKFGARILFVAEDAYYIGDEPYNSLSSAAEAASGIVRKSGWVYWKLPDGRSLKEAFKD
jgi:hypothetical protein